MLKLTRRSTFETNSSSCHTLVLLAKDFPQTQSNSTTISLELDEFGWGYDIITDSHNKLNYLFTYVVNYGSNDEKKVFIDKLLKYYPNLASVQVHKEDLDFDTFKEQLLSDAFEDQYDYSYIDHQSIPTARNILKSLSFAEYLDNRCTLYISNDNSSYNPFVDKKLAKAAGITEELANEIASESSTSYHTAEPYELTYVLKETIQNLGFKLIG